jgi:hypothetical protein
MSRVLSASARSEFGVAEVSGKGLHCQIPMCPCDGVLLRLRGPFVRDTVDVRPTKAGLYRSLANCHAVRGVAPYRSSPGRHE